MITRLLNYLIFKERSVSILALSCAVGTYIAFSPFIGFHTIMTFGISWLFSLNTAVVFIVSHIINNPWTMIPVYGSGYLVGQWILVDCCGMDMMATNPTWMIYINKPLIYLLGIEGISIWSFLLGGNIIGITLALLCYPVMKKIFTRMIKPEPLS